MQVSIIVPAYNGKEFIGETIGALLRQTFDDFEIVVVDDGSTDKTAEIVKSFQQDLQGQESKVKDQEERDSSAIAPMAIGESLGMTHALSQSAGQAGTGNRIKYFHKENSGNQAIPRNFGIKKAQGEYIAFCDQDDLWYPEKLEKQMASISQKSKVKNQKNLDSRLPPRLSPRFGEAGGEAGRGNDKRGKKNVGIIVASADIIDEKGKKLGVRYVPEGYMDARESFKMLLDEDFITACSALVPRKILDEVGLLNEGLSGNDDYDLWLKITKKYGIYGISEPLCAWRRSGRAFSHDMSRVFSENKKIFNSLKADNKEEEKLIKDGANKNLVRLFVAYVKEGQYDKAKDVLGQIKPFEGMAKVKLIIKIFKLSPQLARAVVLTFHKIKKGS